MEGTGGHRPFDSRVITLATGPPAAASAPVGAFTHTWSGAGRLDSSVSARGRPAARARRDRSCRDECPYADDRRLVHVEITRVGLSVLSIVNAQFESWLLVMAFDLSERELRKLNITLRSIRARVSRARDYAPPRHPDPSLRGYAGG